MRQQGRGHAALHRYVPRTTARERHCLWAQLWADTGKSPTPTHTASVHGTRERSAEVLVLAVDEPAPEPEAVSPQQHRMVPHLIKPVERQG